jgi:dipeptidyl aminopeptidase/acylaminoacyl peptidase
VVYVIRQILAPTIAALVCSVWGVSAAQTALQDLFRNERFANATLSPNGKFLAATVNIGGRMQLAVVDVETSEAKNVVGYETLDVVRVRWINNERMVFSTVDREGEQNSSFSGLYAIDRDGTKSKTLMFAADQIRGEVDLQDWAAQPRRMEAVEVVRDAPSSIVAIGYYVNGDAHPFIVDTLTGRRQKVSVDVPGIARDFGFDQKNVLRIVTTANADASRLTIWYRDGGEKSWRKLSEHPRFSRPFSVMGFDEDGTTMFVSALTPEGRAGVFRYDFSGNRVGELLVSDKTVDADGDLVRAPDSGKVLGVRVPSDPPRTVWFDNALASLQLGIDKAIPGMVNVISPGNAQAPALIRSYSSQHPTKYTLYHSKVKKLQGLFSARPWVDAKKMSEQLIYSYVARDGLPITSFLTLPFGRDAKALPLVVSVHGGPWARNEWGFDPEVQFYAQMGYAVLQPQFRGSTGYGPVHERKSYGQWGLAMQDDVTDGVLSLIKTGMVDGKRICIAGASYGGYAAMMGVVRDSTLYRCAINLMGVTNLFYLFQNRSYWGENRELQYDRKVTLGDPEKLRDQFVSTSPSLQAEKIRVPVFMAYGEYDQVVPPIHGQEMRDALKRLGKTYEYLQLDKEEHGFAKEETRYRVYSAIEAFLRKHNPP